MDVCGRTVLQFLEAREWTRALRVGDYQSKGEGVVKRVNGIEPLSFAYR